MSVKTLSLALALVMFAGSLVPAKQKQQDGQSRSPKQSKVAVPNSIPLEIKGDRIGESFEEFKKHYPQAECSKESESVTECKQHTHVSLAGEKTTDEYCGPDMRDRSSMQACMFQGVHAQFESDKLRTLAYWFPTIGNDQVCESFTKKYGKPNATVCRWWNGEVFLSVEHPRPIETGAPWVVVTLSNSDPSKDI